MVVHEKYLSQCSRNIYGSAQELFDNDAQEIFSNDAREMFNDNAQRNI